MSINIKCGDHIFNDIELILLDTYGTLFDSNNLWLKQIGYLSQRLAEENANVRGELFRIRAMIMKALGVDPETGELDYKSAFFTSNNSELVNIIATSLYLNNINWLEAFNCVSNIFEEIKNEISIKDYLKFYPDSEKFCETFTKYIKVVTYSKRAFEDSNIIDDKNYSLNGIEKNYSMFNTDLRNTFDKEYRFFTVISNELNIKPENILVIADSINDFSTYEDLSVNRLVVNRNNIDDSYFKYFNLQHIITKLKEVEKVNE